MTETTDTTTDDGETTHKPTRDDGQPMKLKEMDHTSPVEGTRRVFERAGEGRTPQPDGGQPADATQARPDADDRPMKLREMDHTPPVDGPNRTFERGLETDVGE